MNGRVPIGLALAVATWSLAGCGVFTRANPTVRGPRHAVAEPSVAVLDRGAEPRRPLRFALPVGSVADVEVRADLHITQRPTGSSSDTTTVVVDPPATFQRVRYTVTGSDANGHDVHFEVIDAGVDPTNTTLIDDQIATLTAQLRRLVGLAGELRLDRRGAVGSITFGPPPDGDETDDQRDEGSGDQTDARTEALLDQVEQHITTVVPVLPVEAVGRGARWRTVGRSTLAGTTLRQTTTYEITAIDDDVVLYRATVRQEAGEQPLAGVGPADGSDSTGAARLVAANVDGVTNGRLSLVDLTTDFETRLSGSQLVDPDGRADGRVRQDLELDVSANPPG